MSLEKKPLHTNGLKCHGINSFFLTSFYIALDQQVSVLLKSDYLCAFSPED